MIVSLLLCDQDEALDETKAAVNLSPTPSEMAIPTGNYMYINRINLSLSLHSNDYNYIDYAWICW